MTRLQNEIVLVTGGARGQGAAHARACVAEGARVVIADVLVDEGTALAAEIGEAAAFTRLDVTDEDSWTAAVELTERTFGPATVLVNNAGIVRHQPLLEEDRQHWQQVLDVNLTGSGSASGPWLPG